MGLCAAGCVAVRQTSSPDKHVGCEGGWGSLEAAGDGVAPAERSHDVVQLCVGVHPVACKQLDGNELALVQLRVSVRLCSRGGVPAARRRDAGEQRGRVQHGCGVDERAGPVA